DHYNDYIEKLLSRGDAYYAMETPEELSAMRDRARAEKRAFKYPRPNPLPTVEAGRAARAAGREVSVRFKMPERDIVVHDRVLGEVRTARAELEDFVIQKSDGWPTYHFACVVDDELMKITHVLRGQEHLMNTPKHVALQGALGFSTPVYGHMPLIFNLDGSKMSKRDKEKALAKGLTPPEIDVHDFRAAGYLPEALLNFVSLLGWSTGSDREQISLDETVAAFSVERIGKTNAKFDRDKLVAFNTNWAARLPAERLVAALRDFATVNGLPLASASDDTLAHLLRANEGFRTFKDVADKSAFLFADDEGVAYDAKAVDKVLAKNDGAGFGVLQDALTELEGVPDWTAGALESWMKRTCESRGMGLGAVAQPLRVAVTGSTVSPPIYDTLVLLGRSRTLKRVRRALALRN
ncbi:MAG: glutamate--tRNA ligase, partial [Phycisphaerales bacterium]|nr:glutamate--tRNA ligase [Phycisphaerales bacterium]